LAVHYSTEFGEETITLTDKNLEVASVEKGIGYFILQPAGHRGEFKIQAMKTPLAAYVLDEPQPAEHAEAKLPDGSGQVKMTLPERFDCAGFVTALRGNGMPMGGYVMGGFRAPAVHIRYQGHRGDDWVFLFRSPSASYRWLPEKNALSLARKSGQLTATLYEQPQGGLEIALSNSGEGYGEGDLFLRRAIKYMRTSFDDRISEIREGTGTLTWSPSRRNFDFISLTSSATKYDSGPEFFQALGMDAGEIEGVRAQGSSFYCDGPGLDYALYLEGRKFVTNDQDFTKLSVVPLA
jgi:hypothetical protein